MKSLVHVLRDPDVMYQFVCSPCANWYIYLDVPQRLSEWGHNRTSLKCWVKAKMLQAKFHRDVA